MRCAFSAQKLSFGVLGGRGALSPFCFEALTYSSSHDDSSSTSSINLRNRCHAVVGGTPFGMASLRRGETMALGSSSSSSSPSSLLVMARRSVLVGPSPADGEREGEPNPSSSSSPRSSPQTDMPTPASVSEKVTESLFTDKIRDFGSVKRREQRRQERLIRNKAALDTIAYIEKTVSRPTPSQELEAQSILKDMGFLHKPPSTLYFRQFLSELRRYRVDLSLFPHNTDVQLITVTDYGLDGKGESEVILIDNLRAAANDSTSLLSDIHDCISMLLYTTKPCAHQGITIRNEFGITYTLIIESVLPLDGGADTTASPTSPSPSPSSFSSAEEEALEKAAAEHQRLLLESLKKPFEVVPGGPYRRYLQRINAVLVNEQSGARKEIFSNVSIQAFVYMMMMAFSRFMKGTKAMKNCPFDEESVSCLRYSMVNLRQQIGMEPIGEFELDMLLPKQDNAK